MLFHNEITIIYIDLDYILRIIINKIGEYDITLIHQIFHNYVLDNL